MPHAIKVKTILNKKKFRDSWFLDEYTLNPYSSCSFNCLYCYIRGSKYGEHMEHKMAYKENAVELLDKQLKLRAKKGEYGIIVVSSATDPYLQIEKELELTRKLLEVIEFYKFPVHIITKSDLITRDFDILKRINENAVLPKDLQSKLKGTLITFSFSMLEDDIAAIFEPGATPPSLRLETLIKTKEAGFRTGVSLMPLLPYITDNGEQLETIFSTFGKLKIDYILPATLTLFGNERADSKTLVFRAVEKHYPHLLEKYEQFFKNSNDMPAYFKVAFDKKTTELCLKYGLKKSIL